MQKYVNLVDLVKSFPTSTVESCAILKRSFLSMYVIATASRPNFHFSVSPHVPFLNLLFERIANSNEYLLAKIGVDTAENEPLNVWRKIQFNIHLPP